MSELFHNKPNFTQHYNDVIMGAMASQITSLTIGLLNRLFGRRSKKTSKHCVTGLWQRIQRWPVNSLHKWPVMWKMFPFDDIMQAAYFWDNYVYFSCSTPKKKVLFTKEMTSDQWTAVSSRNAYSLRNKGHWGKDFPHWTHNHDNTDSGVSKNKNFCQKMFYCCQV